MIRHNKHFYQKHRANGLDICVFLFFKRLPYLFSRLSELYWYCYKFEKYAFHLRKNCIRTLWPFICRIDAISKKSGPFLPPISQRVFFFFPLRGSTEGLESIGAVCYVLTQSGIVTVSLFSTAASALRLPLRLKMISPWHKNLPQSMRYWKKCLRVKFPLSSLGTSSSITSAVTPPVPVVSSKYCVWEPVWACHGSDLT